MHFLLRQPASLVVKTKRVVFSNSRMHNDILFTCYSSSLQHVADFFLMEKKLEVTSYFAFIRGHYCIVEELYNGGQELA